MKLRPDTGVKYLMTELAKDSHDRARRKGWWVDCVALPMTGLDPLTLPLDRNLVADKIPEKLCLIHSEVSEALECHRNNEPLSYPAPDGKPEGLGPELADVVIRVFDLCGALGIDIEAEVIRKARYNETRPQRHGGKRC